LGCESETPILIVPCKRVKPPSLRLREARGCRIGLLLGRSPSWVQNLGDLKSISRRRKLTWAAGAEAEGATSRDPAAVAAAVKGVGQGARGSRRMEIRRGSPRRRREYRQKVNDRPDRIEKCLGLLAERLEWR
jgi:hypothetical protein